MISNLPAGLLLLSAFALAAQAQTAPAAAPDSDTQPPAASVQRQRRGNLGSPEAEMLDRARIRHEEESHREFRERAGEAAQLGEELRKAYESGRGFGRDEMKKLERVEKLARKIRSGVGGSGDDDRLEDPPDGIDAAIAHLAALTEELNEAVKKTSRLVVSAAVIERSNRVIELVRHLRSVLPR
ncbi:MAG TPA: hypothetical protein VEY09_01300 [Pyrinomonadaceae bacterium]|nr:hypothetical protein [Pyrinomonadaceae bacterium]